MISTLIGLLAIVLIPTNEGYDLTKLAVKVPSNNVIQPIARTVKGFFQLIEKSDIFIDKTLMISDLFDRHNYMCVLTNPTKWGKTIILDMIRVFLQINVDENGDEILPRENSAAYQLFMHGEITWTNPPAKLRSPLAISEQKFMIEKYLGVYPVLFVDFRNITGYTYEYLYEMSKARIQKIFIEHGHMLAWLQKQLSTNITSHQRTDLENDVATFEKYIEAGERVDYEMLTKSLHFLGNLLWRRYGKQVIFLADDYDVAYRNVLFQDKLTKTDCNKIMKFYRELFEYTLDRESTFLHQAILTGTFHLGKGSRLTPYHKSMRYHLINNPYSDYYGFSQWDISRFVDYLKIPPDTAAHIKYWYGGYFIGKNFTREVYNPMSIISFVQSKLLKSYLRKKEPRDLLYSFLRIKALRLTFEQLLNNQRMMISKTRLCFSNGDIMHIRDLQADPNLGLEKRSHEIALAYLAATGYLALSGIQYVSSFDQFNVYVRIPNKEILYDFSARLQNQYAIEFNHQLSAVDVVAANFVDFYKEDTATHEALAQSLSILIEDLMIFCTPQPNNTNDTNTTSAVPDQTLVLNENLVYSLFNFIAIKIRSIHRLQCKVPRQKNKPFMTLSKGVRYAIIAIKFTVQPEQNATDPLDMAKSHASIFPRFTGIRYIGIEITVNKTVSVKGETIYSKNR